MEKFITYGALKTLSSHLGSFPQGDFFLFLLNTCGKMKINFDLEEETKAHQLIFYRTLPSVYEWDMVVKACFRRGTV